VRAHCVARRRGGCGVNRGARATTRQKPPHRILEAVSQCIRHRTGRQAGRIAERVAAGKFSRCLLPQYGQPGRSSAVGNTTKAAQKLGIEVVLLDVRTRDDIPAAFDMAKARHVDTLLVDIDALIQKYGQLIADLAAKPRLAAIYPSREFVDAGGLTAYGVSYPRSLFPVRDLHRQDFPWCEGGGSARRAADEARTRHQPQGGERARPRRLASPAVAGRPGDRMILPQCGKRQVGAFLLNCAG
jgi:hypothetical protein